MLLSDLLTQKEKINQVTDFNAIATNGIKRGSGATGAPVGTGSWFVQTMIMDASNAVQTAYGYAGNDGVTTSRVKTGGVWGSWTAAGGSGFKTGDMLTTSRTLSAPDWVPADGSVYLQSSYPALFAAVGKKAGKNALTVWSSNLNTALSFGDELYFFNDLYMATGTRYSTANPGIITSTNGITWTGRSIFSGTSAVNAIAYNNGQFVAVGRDGGSSYGAIATSPDGMTWTTRVSNVASYAELYGVAYGNGVYVAVGGSTTLLTSPDGITWTARTSPAASTSSTLSTIAFGNGCFVASGGQVAGTMFRSTDGISWTAFNAFQSTIRINIADVTTSVNEISFIDGAFYAVGPAGLITKSTDGLIWSSIASGTIGVNLNDLKSITYGAGIFAVNTTERFYFSRDNGASWQGVSRATPMSQHKIKFLNDRFFLTGSSGLFSGGLGYSDATQFAVPVLTNSYVKT